MSQQTYKDFEVIVVDNGSTDGALDGVGSRWPRLTLHVERLVENRGFVAANNLRARLVQGHWLALLNSDAFPDPDWLEKLLQAAERYLEFPFFASRQLQANAPHLLDGAGDAVHISGLAWRRYAGFPAARFGLETEEVFSPCAAAALYPRRAFLQVGRFDEDFFSYHEDVDTGFPLAYQTLLQKPSKHKGHEPPKTGGRWARRKSLYHLSFVYFVSFVLKTFLQ